MWRIKNSGSTVWPDDTYVRVHTNDEGDELLFCSADSRVHVGALAPNEETEVGALIHIANGADGASAEKAGGTAIGDGNYMNVFCLCTELADAPTISRGTTYTAMETNEDEHIISAGLYLDVNIASANASSTIMNTSGIVGSVDGAILGTTVADVLQPKKEQEDSTMSTSVSTDSVVSVSSAGGWQVVDTEDNGANTIVNNAITAAPVQPAGVVVKSINDDELSVAVEAPDEASTVDAEVAVNTVANANVGQSLLSDDATTKWSVELTALAEMGFVDFSVVIPVLEKHITVPKAELLKSVAANQPGDEDVATAMRVHTEGVQAAVTEMLGSSMQFLR